MKYIKVCLAIICVLIISLAIGFWTFFLIDKIAALSLIVPQRYAYIPNEIKKTIAQSLLIGDQNLPKSDMAGASTTKHTDYKGVTDIPSSTPEYPFIIRAASSTTPAKFRLIEKVDFNKFLGEKYQNITGQTYDKACGPGSIDAYEISYGDLTGDRTEEAVVNYYTCFTGTSGGVSEVYMLDGKGSLLDVTPDLTEIPLRDNIFKGDEGHEYYHIDNTTLIYDFTVYNEGDSNCCSTGGKITIIFKWNGNKFIYDKYTFDPMIYKK